MLRSPTGFETDECKPTPSTRTASGESGSYACFTGRSQCLTNVVSSPQAHHPVPFGKELHIARRLFEEEWNLEEM